MRTRFTDLVGCSVPIQQAGMGGVTTPELALAVTEAGGLGMLAAVMVPPAALGEMLDRMRAATSGPFGVNFLMPFLDREAVAVAASRTRVVEFFYGAPAADLIEMVHSGGALAAWQVGSCAEARAAVEAGCDFVIAQGEEAGGHVRGHVGLLPLLAEVLDAVEAPVLAAGGIGTGRAVAAALAAGAAGVRVGTRFVAAAESGAHARYIEALCAARAEDTVLTEAFSVMWPHAPHRVLRSCVAAAQARHEEVIGRHVEGGQVMPVPRLSVICPARGTEGAIEAMALYAGESVGAVRAVQPAAAILRQLMDEAEACLRRLVG